MDVSPAWPSTRCCICIYASINGGQSWAVGRGGSRLQWKRTEVVYLRQGVVQAMWVRPGSVYLLSEHAPENNISISYALEAGV